jgi:hypothetical protein
MWRRTLIALAASAIIGIGCIAMVSTDAFARGGRAGGVGRAGGGVHHAGVHRGGVGRAGVGVHHAGVYRGGVHHVGVAPVRRGVAVGVGAAAVGAAATHRAYCGYPPYPPCY